MERDWLDQWKVPLVAAIAVIFLLIAANPFVIISPGQAGVISILGKAREGALYEGTHLKPPLIAKVDIYDLTVQKFEVPAQRQYSRRFTCY